MGSPIQTDAEIADDEARYRAVSFSPRDGFQDGVSVVGINDVLLQYDSLVWLDIRDPRAEDRELLREEFGIHPLALEEVTGNHPRPKCAEYPGYYLLVMNAASVIADEVTLRQVVAFVGQKFIVTAHPAPFPEIDECLRRWQANSEFQGASIAVPLYSLLDTLVDGYFPVVDHLAEHIDRIEDQVLDEKNEAPPRNLYLLKRELLDLRRVMSAQRDAVNTLLRQDIQLFPAESAIFFQSVFDHLVRQVETIDLYRELLSSALDMHLSVISNRLNQVMKTLTAWSIILMAGSLVAGIYGMNFKNMPELTTRYGYYVILSAIATIAGGLALYFRKIKWM